MQKCGIGKKPDLVYLYDVKPMQFFRVIPQAFAFFRAPFLVFLLTVFSPGLVRSAIVINEVMANNMTIVANHASLFSDWIEIYNSGTNALPLDGYYLANNYTNLAQWAFPTNTTLNAGQFLVVYVDGNSSESISNDFPAPVSPVSTFSPAPGSIANSSTMARLRTLR